MKTRKVDKYGSRAKVWRGGAEMTVGGLRKDDLLKTKRGRIVSKKKHFKMVAGQSENGMTEKQEEEEEVLNA
jgi:hypothetical protein